MHVCVPFWFWNFLACKILIGGLFSYGEFWERKEVTFYLPNGSTPIDTHKNTVCFTTKLLFVFFCNLRSSFFVISGTFIRETFMEIGCQWYEPIRGRYNHVITGTLSSSPEWTTIIFIHDFVCIWIFFAAAVVDYVVVFFRNTECTKQLRASSYFSPFSLSTIYLLRVSFVSCF